MTEVPERFLGQAAGEAGKLLPEVYKDALQPATREVGSTLGRTVKAALAPVRALVWSWEQAEAWLESTVTERLEKRGVGLDVVVTPGPQLTAGIIRGVQVSGPEADSTLRELFGNLLATAMEQDRSGDAHPAFAEILSHLTSDEARILVALARRCPSPLVKGVAVYEVQGFIGVEQERYFEADVLTSEVSLSHPDRLASYLEGVEKFT